MQLKYRAGLVGAGYISEYHVAAVRRLGERAELIGICDIDRLRAEKAAAAHNIRAYSSMADMVAAGANVVHVLTPPHTHAAVAMDALDRGCNVLVEKPLDEDVEACV